MPTVRSDFKPIAGTEKPGVGLINKAKPCGAREQQHPLSFLLIVPGAGWARLTLRDDPLDAHPREGQEHIDAFRGMRVGQRREQVHKGAAADRIARVLVIAKTSALLPVRSSLSRRESR